MTDEQRRRRTSYQAILDHFDAHPDLWSAKPPAVEAIGLWRGHLATVAAEEATQGKDTTGTTRTRDQQVDHVIGLAMTLAKKLRVYARLAGDAELLPTVDLSETELDRMNDVEMVSELANLTAAARSRLDKLTTYEVTEPELATLDTEAAKILPKQSDRISADDARTVATARLRAVFALFPPLRKVLDDIVDSLIPDDDFRDGFYQARKVDD